MRTRKGIAPVVATIILVLIVIVAAGGAFTWINQIINDQIEEADRARNRDVAVRDVQCEEGTGNLGWLLVNSGSIDLDASANSVNLYVYNVSNGNLWATESVGETADDETFSAGEQWNNATGANFPGHTFSGITFESGSPVNIQFEFTNSDGYTISVQCDPS